MVYMRLALFVSTVVSRSKNDGFSSVFGIFSEFSEESLGVERKKGLGNGCGEESPIAR